MLSFVLPLTVYFITSGAAATESPNTISLERRNDTLEEFSKLWSFTGCSDPEKGAIKDGLGEANTILLNPGTSDIGNHWDYYAVVEFFGPPLILYNKRDNVRSMLNDASLASVALLIGELANYWNARNYQDHWWSGNEVQIFCHDKPNTVPGGPTSCQSYGGHIKVEQAGGTDNGLAMIFCSSWFSLGTLDAVFQRTSTGPDKYDISKYDNRALHWVGAMMQIPTINTLDVKLKQQRLSFPTQNPLRWIEDYVRGPENVKYLGKLFEGGYQGAKILSNIDTWSWYSMATYVQDKLGEYPYKPQVPKSLPTMRDGYVVPAGTVTLTNVTMPDDPDLSALQASMDQG